jgi:AAA15 family ATPase/GTPase
VVLLASTITAHPKGVLFIDEVETGIHVSALRRVFTWLTSVAVQFNVQVVATTHSLEAVDALLAGTENTKGELVAFHLDQTPEVTRARRFDRDLLSRLRRERGLDVR